MNVAGTPRVSFSRQPKIASNIMDTDKWIRDNLAELFPERDHDDIANAVDKAGALIRLQKIKKRDIERETTE